MAAGDKTVGVSGARARLELDRGLECSVDSRGYFARLGHGWEQALGWTREDLMSRPFADFVHPNDREHAIAAVLRLSQGGSAPQALESRFRAPGGGWRRLRWRPVAEQGIPTVPAPRHARTPWLALSLVVAAAGLIWALPLGWGGAPGRPAPPGIRIAPGLHDPVIDSRPLLPTWRGDRPPPGVLGGPITRSGLP